MAPFLVTSHSPTIRPKCLASLNEAAFSGYHLRRDEVAFVPSRQRLSASRKKRFEPYAEDSSCSQYPPDPSLARMRSNSFARCLHSTAAVSAAAEPNHP